MTEYDNLLEEAKQKAAAFQSTAKEYIPRMYAALRREDPYMSSQDARERIEKDRIGFWSKRTILEVLPAEAKNPEKQKSGRLSQKKHNFAAVSAAPEVKEILVATDGRPIAAPLKQEVENKKPLFDTAGNEREPIVVQPTSILDSELLGIEEQRKECKRCKFLQQKYEELRLKLADYEDVVRTHTSIKTAEEIIHRNADGYVQFEFSVPFEPLHQHMITTINSNRSVDRVWFTGKLNRETGKVVDVRMGKTIDTRDIKKESKTSAVLKDDTLNDITGD